MSASHDAGDSPDATAATGPAEPPSFEDALLELNDIVARLEAGGLGLAASIAAYERGVTLLGRLHGHLSAVEERVRMLVRIDEDGRPIIDPAGGPAAPRETAGRPANGDRGEARTTASHKARPGRPKRLPGMDDPGEDA